MKLPRRQFLHLAAGAAALPAVSRSASAQAYPTRPVRWIVGFSAGGASDLLARVLSPALSERLGQQFIVEDQPGAGTNIATEAVVKAAPDGYTLLMATSSNAINATLYAHLNFDFMRDTVPVASIARLRSSWWSICRSRRIRSPSSSPMPRPIPTRSTWRRQARAARRTSRESCL